MTSITQAIGSNDTEHIVLVCMRKDSNEWMFLFWEHPLIAISFMTAKEYIPFILNH